MPHNGGDWCPLELLETTMAGTLSAICHVEAFVSITQFRLVSLWPAPLRLNLRASGMGIGVVFGSLILGYARNPTLKQQLFSYAIIGFALTEAMGLFCLMMAFIMMFAM
uniref:ATPase protein 9 n=1 Tax=Timema genevievae TaxID=629358 RepID=A0A7R9JRB9_TIMGE|nr:unnamed protein product [Timema genevievae]